MAAARTGNPTTVANVITTQRVHLLQVLRNLEALRRDPAHDQVVRLLLAAAARHVSADLAFLEDAETALDTSEAPTEARDAKPKSALGQAIQEAAA